jgi:Carboxypeptidase regulatory-like domain
MTKVCASLTFAGLALLQCACGSGVSLPAPSPAPLSPPVQVTVTVTGYVDDTTFKAMSGVVVDVLDGPQAGSSTVTDANGRFTLSGQFDQATRFRASKDGYPAAIQTRQAMPMLFFLGAGGPAGNMATLTVETDAACAALPANARMRTYPASVTAEPRLQPDNRTFFATLSGATLDTYFHFVVIEVEGDLVTFDLSDNGIDEEIAEETYLFVGGVGSIRPPSGATTISALLTTGYLDYCVLKSDPGAGYPCTDQAITRVQCPSPKITLTWR